MKQLLIFVTLALVACVRKEAPVYPREQIRPINLVCQVERVTNYVTVFLSIKEGHDRYFINDGNGWRYQDGLVQTEKSFVLEKKPVLGGSVTSEIDRMSGLYRTYHVDEGYGVISDRGGECTEIASKDMPPGRPTFKTKL